MTASLYDPTQTTPVINITQSAVDQVKQLLQDEKEAGLDEKPSVGLRVFVQGGGCSGFQYGFVFEDTISDDDFVIDNDGVIVVVDELSYPYLSGATINYKTEIYGSRFEISNPNATGTCGCGSSFTI